MLQATFCLEPPGDSVSRKGIVDAIQLGCIPVLFERDQERLWPWHFGASAGKVQVPWRDFSVRLDAFAFMRKRNRDNVIRALRAIPAGVVARLRSSLQRAAAHLAYEPQEGRHDAFEIMLHGVCAASGAPFCRAN